MAIITTITTRIFSSVESRQEMSDFMTAVTVSEASRNLIRETVEAVPAVYHTVAVGVYTEAPAEGEAPVAKPGGTFMFFDADKTRCDLFVTMDDDEFVKMLNEVEQNPNAPHVFSGGVLTVGDKEAIDDSAQMYGITYFPASGEGESYAEIMRTAHCLDTLPILDHRVVINHGVDTYSEMYFDNGSSLRVVYDGQVYIDLNCKHSVIEHPQADSEATCYNIVGTEMDVVPACLAKA